MVVTPSFRVMPNPYGHFQDARNAAEDRANARADRDYRDTQRRAAQAYGQHVAAGQYDDAATVAGKMGDAEAATSARTMGHEEVFRSAREFQFRLEEIAQISDPYERATAYAQWRHDALTRAQRGGVLDDEARARFEEDHPPRLIDLEARLPQLIQRGRERLIAMAEGNVGSAEWLEGERAEQRYAREQSEIRWDHDAYGVVYGMDGRGHTYRQDENGNPVRSNAPVPQPRDRVPGPAQYGAAGLTAEQIRAEQAFSDDWRRVYDNWSEIRDSQQRIETVGGLHTSAGDLALVVAFTKMLDPGSVAREGEVALTQRAASVLAQVQNMPAQWVRGRTLLPPDVREELIRASTEMFANYERAYDTLAQDYSNTAQQYGFEPSRVMMGYRSAEERNAGRGGGAGGASQLPPRPNNVPADYVTLYDEEGNPIGYGPPPSAGRR